ncbi:energy-coupling factor ABC transporter substrate-binding protein [Streptomonospora algeriensis]|uniref:Cobalt transport protein CbiN n=1 Tax=Streptomonospora algeriensis TaxID=995084 RepID=A0ABW3BGM2_9ACTN
MRPKTTTTWLLIAAAALIAVLPLLIGSGSHLEEPFGGVDAQAPEMATEIDPGYEPWFTPFYEPPSGEIESGLFALQAAIGAGFIGYFFGVVRTRRKLAEGSGSAASTQADNAGAAQADAGPAEH